MARPRYDTPLVYYINSLVLSVTRQFCCKSILWQNRPLYNFGAAGRGGGETHTSHRSRRHHCLLVCQSVCLYLTLTYFKLPWGGERNKDVIK